MTSTTKGRTVVSFREVGIGAVFHMGPEGGSPFVKTSKSVGVSLASTNSQPAAPVSLFPSERVFVTPAVTPYFSTYYDRTTRTWWATVNRENGDQIGDAKFSGQKASVVSDAIETLREIFAADPALFDGPAADKAETEEYANDVERLQRHPDDLRRIFGGYLQTIPAHVLAAMLTGVVSLPDSIKLELASRGVDNNAKWIGFDVASRFWGVRS